MRTSLGLLRSLVVYWRPGRQRGLRRLYAPFVGPDDLVFDIGAHLGDRTRAFHALGAGVVAFEPQPHVARWLRRLVGRLDRVTLRHEAVGAREGRAVLAVSGANPTVSTLAAQWRARIGEANPGFASVEWDDAVEVPVTTLDRLIAEHGRPRFCKIDVEGYEAEVLAGLSQPIAALSIEFVQGSLDVALACVARLGELGDYRFNAVAGETRHFLFGDWIGSDEVVAWFNSGADGIASGDLYARLVTTESE